MAYIYFSIVQRKGKAPLNLPSVLVHILNRKDKQDGTENEENPREDSKSFFNFTLKTLFWLLPFTYPIGKISFFES